MSTASLSLPSDFIKYSIENEVRIFIMMIFFFSQGEQPSFDLYYGF